MYAFHDPHNDAYMCKVDNVLVSKDNKPKKAKARNYWNIHIKYALMQIYLMKVHFIQCVKMQNRKARVSCTELFKFGFRQKRHKKGNG